MSAAAFLAAIGGPSVLVSNQNIGDIQTSPIGAYAGYTLNSSGIVQQTTGGGTSTLETWLRRGAASDYEARATLNSGSLDGGSSATGSWLALSSSRAWYVQDVSPIGGAITANLTIEIRSAITGNVLDSATVTLSAQQV